VFPMVYSPFFPAHPSSSPSRSLAPPSSRAAGVAPGHGAVPVQGKKKIGPLCG
jgi:hypothetical protein